MKKLIMSNYELEETYNRFFPDLLPYIENGYLIYLRHNGYLVVKPDAKISKAKMDKIEKNYCLFN